MTGSAIRQIARPRTLFALVLAVFFSRFAGAAELPEEFSDVERLELREAFPPFGFDAKHVQGLAVAEDFFYFTSVDKRASRGWLYKIERETGKTVLRKNLAKAFHSHPSGFQFDGSRLWIATAVYAEGGGSIVRAHDPKTLDPLFAFEFADHIGALASDGTDRLYGANWDAKKFYVWNWKGKLLETRETPTGRAYQDCEWHQGFLLCSGDGRLDWIDVETWRLAKSLDVGNLETKTGERMTREGMSLFKGVYYFLPEDGAAARVYAAERKKRPGS